MLPKLHRAPMVQVGGRLLAHYLLALPMPVLVALLGLLADFLLPPFCALTLLAWSINDIRYQSRGAATKASRAHWCKCKWDQWSGNQSTTR